jgi:hypothetical protein
MLSRAISSDHLPPAGLSDSAIIEHQDVPSEKKSIASLRSFFDSSLSKDHATLLAAAEKAKLHFSSLPATENRPSSVTEKIIGSERWAAKNSAASANEAKNQATSIINTLRYQCTDQKLLSTVASLESRLQQASEQATASATHATSTIQKQMVQVDAKSAALHAADARLAFAQLLQLEPQRSAKNLKQGEADLKKAETDYQKASHELTSLLKATSPSFEVVTDDDNLSVVEEDDESELEKLGILREVSDEEALRRVEADRMGHEDKRIQ